MHACLRMAAPCNALICLLSWLLMEDIVSCTARLLSLRTRYVLVVDGRPTVRCPSCVANRERPSHHHPECWQYLWGDARRVSFLMQWWYFCSTSYVTISVTSDTSCRPVSFTVTSDTSCRPMSLSITIINLLSQQIRNRFSACHHTLIKT